MQVKMKLVAAAAVALLTGAVSAQDLVVKIGHVGPTSGAIAHLGKDNENGARMAIEELNAKGVTMVVVANEGKESGMRLSLGASGVSIKLK